MKKVYKDPVFKNWRKLKFPEVDSSRLVELDCPPFLEDRSMIDFLEEEDQDFLQWIRDFFKNIDKEEEELDSRVKINPNRSPSKESERIRKNNEELEKKRRRKKKRKDFLDNLFKRKNN